MSETVKLIIEITKEEYEFIKNSLSDSQHPFDDVKAEIKKNILDEPVENGTNAEMACYNGGLLKCLEIIDKHIGKVESED